MDAHRPDAGLPDARDGGRADAGPACDDGVIEWLDPVPELRPMDVDVAPSLVASARGFDLLYQIAGPNPCDGICPWLLRLPTSGPPGVHLPAYWAYEAGTATYLAARVDETGQPSFAAIVGDELLWAGEPSIASWTVPEGRVTLDDTLGDVVFNAEREVLFETHRATTTGGPVAGSRIRVVTRAGALVRTIDVHAIHPLDFWSPRLGLAPDGTVWIGAVSDSWTSPATVNVATLDGGLLEPITSGAGCGDGSFELAPISATETYLVHDCGGTGAGPTVLSHRARGRPGRGVTVTAIVRAAWPPTSPHPARTPRWRTAIPGVR